MSSEQEATLLREAARHGLEPGEYVRDIIERHLPTPENGQLTGNAATPDQRARAFRSWAEGHDHITTVLSDEAISRESIYGDRG